MREAGGTTDRAMKSWVCSGARAVNWERDGAESGSDCDGDEDDWPLTWAGLLSH
jgi:hypothetical protein